jgi:hypothetical protein
MNFVNSYPGYIAGGFGCKSSENVSFRDRSGTSARQYFQEYVAVAREGLKEKGIRPENSKGRAHSQLTYV